MPDVRQSVKAFIATVALATCLGIGASGRASGDRERHTASAEVAPLYEILSGWDGRPVAGRLAGAPYAPHRPEILETFGPERRSLLRLEAEVERRRRSGERGELIDLTARLRLASGRAEEATQLLEEIVAARPDDALAWNDLAVARLELAAIGGAPDLPIRALGAVERARRLNPELESVAFNRALAFERLGLQGPARAEWQALADLGLSGDGWREEAAGRATDLERLEPRDRCEEESRRLLDGWGPHRTEALAELAQEFPTASRQLFRNELLPSWAESLTAGDSMAAVDRLDQARAVARGLERSGDRLYMEAVATIDAAAGNESRLADLAEGHRLFAEANAHYGAWELADAERKWRQARNLFERAESPFDRWVDLELSRCAYQEFAYDELVAGLEGLLAAIDGRSYTSLEARALWVLGLTHHVAGRPTEALTRFERSLETFESSGDRESAGIVAELVGIAAAVVGEYDKEWAHHLRALAALGDIRESGRRTTIYAEAALAAVDLGEPEAGSALLDIVLSDLDAAADPVEAAILLRARAVTALEAKDPEHALGFLVRAEAYRDEVGNQDIWTSLRGDQSAIEGMLLSESDPAAAIAALSEAATIFEGTDFGLRQAQVLHHRALIYGQLGDVTASERDLLSAAAVRESQRASIDDMSARLGHFQLARSVYQELALLRAEQGRFEAALAAAERGRSRDLLDRLAGLKNPSDSPAPPLMDIEKIRERLPPRTAVLVFEVLDDRTLVWVVKRDQVTGLILDRGAADWEAILEPLRASAAWRNIASRWSTAGRTLYEEVILPIETYLLEIDHLAIAPAGPLWEVPFETLRRNASAPALGHRMAVTLTPSASVYLGGAPRPARRATSHALVLGNPAPGADSAYLPRLAGAESEAASLARLYGVDALLGQEASRDSFLSRAPEARVIFIAAHAEINAAHPWLSSLVLAPSKSGESGRVYAHEILDLDLSATELVVLAACRTAAGEAAPGEGVSALVHAFLAAGVPRVVASRRDVEDSPMAFLPAFASAGLLPRRLVKGLGGRTFGFMTFGYLRSTE